MTNKILRNAFEELSDEARELYLDSQVPVLESPPSPLEFQRNWVAANKPVVIRNAASHWPAINKWNNQYLREKVGTKSVTVAVTPNGYADAVYQGRFLMPEERLMTFAAFLDIIEGHQKSSGVFYVQKQNSNLTDEFDRLLDDVDAEVPWASEALGKSPDAVNFWMGEESAVTSTHKDHYENLYTVIRGHKTFLLFPPTDRPFMPYESYPAAKFKEVKQGQFEIEDDPETGQVPWIAIDPLHPDLGKYPDFVHTHPVSVTVHEGEMLYLPSLWFHHVQQSNGCIAVNHWYDMEYDVKYNYFRFVEELCEKHKALKNS